MGVLGDNCLYSALKSKCVGKGLLKQLPGMSVRKGLRAAHVLSCKGGKSRLQQLTVKMKTTHTLKTLLTIRNSSQTKSCSF